MLVQIVKEMRDLITSRLGMLLLACLVILSIARLGVAHAEDSPDSSHKQTVKNVELDQLVKTLQTPALREDLIKKIKMLQSVEGQKPEPSKNILDGLISSITEKSMILTEAMIDLIPSMEKIPAQMIVFCQNFSFQHLKGTLGAIILLGTSILIGLLFETGLHVAFSGIRKKSAPNIAKSIMGQQAFLLTHLSTHLIPIFVFYATSVSFVYLILIFLKQNTLPQIQTITDGLSITILYVLLSIFVYRAIMVVLSVFLSPKSAPERYLKVSDIKAKHMFNFLRGLFAFVAVAFCIENTLEILGIEREVSLLWSRITGLTAVIMAIQFIFHYRSDVATWLNSEIEENQARSNAVREILSFIADIWHLLASLALAIIFITWAINPTAGHTYLVKNIAFTALVIVLARCSHFLIVKMIHLLSNNDGQINGERTSPMPHLDAFLHGVMHFTAFILLLHIWGINLTSLARTHVGEVIISHGIAIFLVILLAIVIWEIVNKLTQNALKPVNMDGKLIQPSSRIKTFLPVVRNVLKWVIITFVVLIIFAELGLNVTTLLAGIGVIGLAVAMGSQKLAQDIVTGIFILMENSIEIGDVVNVGGVNGEVAAFTIRTIVLRNISGEVHTVPYSAIGPVTNLSKDYSNCIMEISVGHDADVPKVMSLFEEVGAAMYADAAFSPKVLTQLKVIGISKITDTAINIMSIMKTEPDPYHLVDQEFRRRLKVKFAELGIQTPAVRQVVSFQENQKHGALRVALEK